MRISRREFLKVAAAAVAAGHLAPSAFAQLQKLLSGRDAPRVIWLQGAGCDGCAVSFLNSVHYATVDDLLVNTLDVKYQSNLQAAAGDLAVSAVQAAGAEPGYILIVEGAIPTGAAGRYCTLWPGMTMENALQTFAPNAAYIIGLGSCASFGGVTGGAPNPTSAKGLKQLMGSDPRVVNIPGCPAHPDWLVGTLVYLMTHNQTPPLDQHRRPLEFFGRRIHDNCFKRHTYCGEPAFAQQLGDVGCMEYLGCKGKHTYSDCPIRKWNSRGHGQSGVNWCIGARSPCLGCVNPSYPDGMSPFYVYLPPPPKPEQPVAPGERPAGEPAPPVRQRNQSS